jgi:hypothetical protein
MTVGVGVGDFIKIFELVVQARKRFVDAPRQYAAISEEYINLSSGLFKSAYAFDWQP